MTNFIKSYYRGGHRVQMGGVPMRVSRLPIGSAGKAMMAESSREMCVPLPPRGKADRLKWEAEQLRNFKAADKLSDRSIIEVVTMPARASTRPVERLQPIRTPFPYPEAFYGSHEACGDAFGGCRADCLCIGATERYKRTHDHLRVLSRLDRQPSR